MTKRLDHAALNREVRIALAEDAERISHSTSDDELGFSRAISELAEELARLGSEAQLDYLRDNYSDKWVQERFPTL